MTISALNRDYLKNNALTYAYHWKKGEEGTATQLTLKAMSRRFEQRLFINVKNQGLIQRAASLAK